MSKYRILEVYGDYIHKCDGSESCDNCNGLPKSVYIPKFIVQKEYDYFCGQGCPIPGTIYKNLKEFTSLDEAKEYKYTLELQNGGIVHE